MVVVGPEAPLVEGIVDFFAADVQCKNVLVVGPSKEAAQLEGSKDYAKAFMGRHNIPTARYATFTKETLQDGLRFLSSLPAPYVLKADGLAAGKGVLIIDSLEEEQKELRAMLIDEKFGNASHRVLIEEYLSGIEMSLFVLTDGKHYVLLPEAKDYKRIGEGDTGLNTGGMGSVTPVPFATPEWMQKVEDDYQFAALYALRLALSRQGTLLHLHEMLYTEKETDMRRSGEKQFDYVDPRNRAVQIEMERACTRHLEEIGARIPSAAGRHRKLDGVVEEVAEAVIASVIIPVYNRERTIMDAVKSALGQECSFPFNVIVVDNHSTDGTTALLNACRDTRLVHLIPEEHDLGIGGCWDKAIRSEWCGRYAVQLDSDDLYSSPATLQRIVNEMERKGAAMCIGAYRMVDFNLQTLPPGLIDHKEWTDENGPNNALRINGLGAPRAFRTSVVREIGFPNTSYGEDYAMGLRISREYPIARIYDELYLCRRWDGNSDAALSLEKQNRNNAYKDQLRTIELEARIKPHPVGGTRH